MMKRIISLILVLAMLTSMAISAGATNSEFSEEYPSESYWATEAINAAFANDILVGKENGNVDSKSNLTRAEMAAFISRILGAVYKAEISQYKDLDPNQWYYEEFAKAVKMGVFTGDQNGNMNPDNPITREEAFTVFSRAMVLSSDDYTSLDKFGDADMISDWAKTYIAPLVEKGYVNGNEIGNVEPKSNITRAEFLQFIHNIFKTYYSVSGTYSNTGSDSSVINTETVNLSNVVIEDDLVIGDGADLSEVNLSNVTINGRLLVRGSATIRLENVVVNGGVVVNNSNATVHFDNYRRETVFDDINMITPATFKEDYSISTGTSSGGSVSKYYSYYIKYYVENIALNDYTLEKTDTERARSGAFVSVNPASKKGFKLNTVKSVLSGNVKKSPALELEVYYDRDVLHTVTFYDNGTLVKTLYVPTNTTVSATDFPTNEHSRVGFIKDSSISSLYTTEYKHIVEWDWWYDATATEYEKFDDTIVITKDTTVKLMSPKANVMLSISSLGENFTFSRYYETDTRFFDTLKDVIYSKTPLTALKQTDYEAKLLEKLEEFNLIDSSKNILNQEILAKFSLIIGETELEKYIVDTAKEMFTKNDKLKTSILDYMELTATSTDVAEVESLKDLIESSLKYAIDNTTLGMTYTKTLCKKLLITDDALFTEITSLDPNNLPPLMTREQIIDALLLEIEVDAAKRDVCIKKSAAYVIKPAYISYLDSMVDCVLKYIESDTAFRDKIVDDIIEKMYRATLDKLLYEIKNEAQFEVNKDNIFIAEGLKLKIQTFDFDGMLNDIPDEFFKVYPKAKIKEIFDDASNRVLLQIDQAFAEAALGNTAFIDTGYNFIINPIVDIYDPLYDSLMQATEVTFGADLYYSQNPYLQEFMKLFASSNLFDGAASPKGSADSGYSLKTIDEYYDILIKASILGDDALVWYSDNLSETDVDNVVLSYQDLVLQYVNVMVGILDVYVDTGSIPSAYENKVTLAVKDAMESKFPSLVNAVKNWYTNGAIKEQYTSNDYKKVRDAVNFAFNNINITTDDFYDEILAKKLGKFQINKDHYKFTVKGNSVDVSREIAD